MIRIKLSYEASLNYSEIVQWCKKEFGSDSKRWIYTSCRYDNRFDISEPTMCFLDDTDAMAFKLRWL